MLNGNHSEKWLGLALACVLAGATAHAVTTNYYVATNGLDTRTGLDWPNAVATITNAVWKASYGAGNVVLISNGTYNLTTNVTFSKTSVLGFSGNRDDVIVDCQHLAWAFWLRNSQALLAHVTITNGRSITNEYPGGVYVEYGLMSNCVVTDCESAQTIAAYYNGGGVLIGGNGTATCCVIKNNIRRAKNLGGGGVTIAWWGSPSNGKLLDSHIIGNSADNSGGGVGFICSAGAIVSNCVIMNNYSKTNGGGLYDGYGNTILRTIIYSNRTDGIGGGLYLSRAAKVNGCLIAANTSTRSAGAASAGAGGLYIDITDGGATVENCTIMNNQASGTSEGGGIYCNGGGKIRNTIIHANSSGSAAASSNWYNNGSAMFYTNCCTMPTNSLPGTGNISANPGCVNPAGGNYHLRPNSTCNNTGTNQDWMTNSIDLDSQIRIRYGTVDIGAYETIYDATLYRAW